MKINKMLLVEYTMIQEFVYEGSLNLLTQTLKVYTDFSIFEF